MKFMLLIYNDPELLDAMPAGEFDAKMRDCLVHADELQSQGCLLESQQLEEPATAKSVRIRKGRQTVVDGPFTETKEVFGGFNLIEAENMEEAARTIFKDKRESLRVQFGTYVQDHNWSEAVRVGEEIIRDFPNTRIASEVREKLDLLRQRAAGLTTAKV